MAAPTKGYNVSQGPYPHYGIPDPFPRDNSNGTIGDFTIEHWYYNYGLSVNSGLIGNNRIGSTWNTAGINIYFRTEVGAGYGLHTHGAFCRVGTVTQNEWTHVAWVREGTTGRVYENGVLVGSSALNNNDMRGTNWTFHPIWNGVSSAVSNTDIARLRFWHKALTVSEVQAAMDAVSVPFGTPGLLAEYMLDSGLQEEPTSRAPRAQLYANSTPIKTVGGTVYGNDGAPTSREIYLLDRRTGALVGQTRSDPVDGSYLAQAHTDSEVARLVISEDDGDPLLLNDIIDRVIPGGP